MKNWYLRIKRRRGAKIGRVAVMRHLRQVMEEMVKRNQPYVIGGLPPATAKPHESQPPTPQPRTPCPVKQKRRAILASPGKARRTRKGVRLMTACQKRIFGGMARCPKGRRPLAEESARGAMRPSCGTLAWAIPRWLASPQSPPPLHQAMSL